MNCENMSIEELIAFLDEEAQKGTDRYNVSQTEAVETGVIIGNYDHGTNLGE